MNTKLIRLHVLVSISDPWEFVTNNGSSRTGVIVDDVSASGDSSPMMRIHLDRKVEASGVPVETVFAVFRHSNFTIQDLLSGHIVPCNFATEMNAELPSRSFLFIGDLQLVP